MTRIIGLASGWLSLACVLNATQLSNGEFKVELAPDFPAVLGYSYMGHAVALAGNANPVVRINGQEAKPAVRLVQVAADAADYELRFADLGVSLTAKVVVSREALTLTLTDVRESGDLAVRTLEIPGLNMLAGAAEAEVALGNFPASSYASEKPEDHDLFGKVGGIVFKDNQANKEKNVNRQGERGVSYAFVSDGKLAAGMYANVMEENLRMIVRFAGEGDGRTMAVAPGTWTYREIPAEICPAPQVVLVVAVDTNGDGKVTWQDAAITYRKHVPQPYGGEKTKDYPIAHIAMNFASQATHPFLRVLDNAKKVWLYTDGLGQRIQYKGFESEGHDSSHPDYAGNVGHRQGGREELNFAMRRGHDFNVHSGIHINAHEYHKESKYFSPDIVDLNAIGWSWLDESYLTDYRHDSAYGTLYQRLDAMREDLPWLDFVYLDVYYGRGWPGWRMHTRNNGNGLLQFTEFPGVMERAVVWNHVANDWTQQIGGKGDRSAIARFIWFSQKDTFRHDPLLRGTNCDGFMGWHGERNLLQTVKSAFTVNLPTKYLQHFSLIRQTEGGAWFNSGARTESDGVIAKIFGSDGQLINSCRYEKPNTRPLDNLSFIPWDPNSEDKIYHWNDKGGSSSWDLPKSWRGRTNAELYRLTDLGRVFERVVELADGKVTLTDIAPITPYVLYRESPVALPEMKWSEGGPVRDTGFDSHTFSAWQTTTPAAVAIDNDPDYGQTELVMATPAAGEVHQSIKNLSPGQIYAASAWVNITGTRDATLAVGPSSNAGRTFVDKLAWKVAPSVKSLGGNRPQKAPMAVVSNTIDQTRLVNFTDQSGKYMRNWHRLKVVFTAPADGQVDLALRAAAVESGAAKVKFDDVRLVKTALSKPPAAARKVVMFEDFENVDEGWGPFMYGWQGPMNTHLSEANPPYTNDTIQGRYSLKSRLEDSPDLLYRTVPATLKLKPNTTYHVSFDYLCDKADCFALIAGHDTGNDRKIELKNNLDGGEWMVRKFSATIRTGSTQDFFVGISKLTKEKKGTVIIDNFLVTE